MSIEQAPIAPPRFLQALVASKGVRRLAVAMLFALILAMEFNPLTLDRFTELWRETSFVALIMLGAHTLAGRWQQSRPPRWVVQLAVMVLAAPVGPLIVQLVSVNGHWSEFVGSRSHVLGFWWITLNAISIGLAVSLAALYLERDAQARTAALSFELERANFERQATQARLSLLQAQIEPHFLLNTLANVQELVENGSPRAVPVFKSLISYLRAAMPQLHHASATLGKEEELVRAYLELMIMRMPDRLTYKIDLDPSLRNMAFPAMALLTLVENAIRHGIDPSCDGGQITVTADVTTTGGGRDQVRISVADTGIGMSETAHPGTGLANLRARLQGFFNAQASLELSEQSPHGLKAEIVLDRP